jgi:translation initiation factor 1
LTAREREFWLKALKSALGCGGSIEDDTIMLQGDQRERLKRILADRGVKKVIVG